MIEQIGGNPAAAQNPWASLLKSVAILRIGTGTLLLVRHGVGGVTGAYQFFWKEQPWPWVTVFHDAGVPYAHLVAPLTAVIVGAVGLFWVLGFLTRLFAVAFLPVVITALVIAQKGGFAMAETAWLYLFISITLLLFGSGAISIDQLFRFGQGGSSRRY